MMMRMEDVEAMKNTVLRMVSLMLALSLVGVGAIAEVTYSQDGSFPICSEPVHLTVGVSDNTLIEDWETNGMTRLIEERGGFDLEFVIYDSVDYVTKLNLMVMAGGDELPDVLFVNVADTMLYQWAQEGAILPLTQYYEDPTISYYLHEAMERTGTDFTKQLIMPDGEIYAIPSFNQSYGNEYANKAYIYKPWLEQMGMELPETTEELYELFKLACSQDWNGNGKADEIALTGTWNHSYRGWFSWLMNAFVYADSNYYFVEDGVVSAAYTTDAWKEGVKFIRSLFEAGYIPIETLTQDDAGFRAIMNATEPTALMLVYAAPDMIDPSLDYRNDYVPLAPVRGPEGVRYATYSPSIAGPAFVVTANCENPEAAFRMGDLMVSENLSIVTRWGEEGVNWDYIANVENAENYLPLVEGWPVYIVAYNDPAYWSAGTVQNAGYRQAGPYIRQYGISNGSGKSPEMLTPYVQNYAKAQAMYQEGGWQPEEVIPKLMYTVEEIEAISECKAALNSFVAEKTAAFLAGTADIDAEWDDFLAECENIGLSAVLEVENTVYTRMYK